MPQEEEQLLRLRQQRSEQAIALAMQGRWQDAVVANKGIIESFPRDVEAYNRLGRACIEMGEYSQAREAYSRAIEIDPYNAITKKNLQRLSYLNEAVVGPGGESHTVDPQHFIEEIGKAGVVNLYNLAPKEVLATMVAGDSIYLKVDAPALIVESGRGEYVGQVDPMHAQRLTKLIEGGNKYTAAVVGSSEDMVTIIIREVYQDPGQAGRLSFPPRGLEEVRPPLSDRALKMEPGFGEGVVEESGYTIIGGEEVEVLPEESNGSEEDEASDEG